MSIETWMFEHAVSFVRSVGSAIATTATALTTRLGWVARERFTIIDAPPLPTLPECMICLGEIPKRQQVGHRIAEATHFLHRECCAHYQQMRESRGRPPRECPACGPGNLFPDMSARIAELRRELETAIDSRDIPTIERFYRNAFFQNMLSPEYFSRLLALSLELENVTLLSWMFVEQRERLSNLQFDRLYEKLETFVTRDILLSPECYSLLLTQSFASRSLDLARTLLERGIVFPDAWMPEMLARAINACFNLNLPEFLILLWEHGIMLPNDSLCNIRKYTVTKIDTLCRGKELSPEARQQFLYLAIDTGEIAVAKRLLQEGLRLSEQDLLTLTVK